MSNDASNQLREDAALVRAIAARVEQRGGGGRTFRVLARSLREDAALLEARRRGRPVMLAVAAELYEMFRDAKAGDGAVWLAISNQEQELWLRFAKELIDRFDLFHERCCDGGDQ